MIELRTLGALELRGADGREFRRVLQQPKRLALLAYVAVATPRRFHRRDSLLGLFWPELDADHARAALRRSLYFLRQALGENVIVGRGDEEVGLAPGALWCDTTAFEDALAAEEPARALDLYRGDLLQGFYISGAPDFERWLEQERARLLERAVAGGWKLAEDLASTEPREAARWARWVADLAPHDERAHGRLIEMLARLGDRAGALRAYESFAKRLRADYEVEPSAATQAVASRLREQVRATPPAPVPNGGVGQHVVAVLPFTVRGSRELGYLGEGMVDLLSTTLDGAGDMRTVDPRALLAHLAREDGAALGPERGRDLARHFGAGRFLLGSIVHAGGHIRISATLYGADARAAGAADVRGTSEAGIFDMVDELARQLLSGQSIGPGSRLSKLATRTTQSLAALKEYLRGECEFRAGRYFQALESFQNAASEDTSFALAYYRLAATAAATANLALAREASTEALRNRERLGSHDRLLLDAQRAWLAGEADEAERLYKAAVATHADDIEAWFLLGDVMFHHNPLRGRPMTDAREAFERALHYEPEHLSSLVHLARLAAFEGRAAELDTLVERILKISPAGDRALSMRALRAFALRNEIEKARIVTALVRARALAVGIAFTDVVLYAQDLTGSYRLARIVTKLTRAAEGRALCHIVLAHLELARGRWSKASANLSLASRHDPAWGLEMRALFALLPFRTPPRAELRSLYSAVERWDAAAVMPNANQVLAAHNGVHGILRLYLLGGLGARLGRAREASAAALELEGRTGDIPHGSFAAFLARSVRAQVAAAEGRAGDALRLLEAPQPAVWYQLAITSPFFSGALERYLRAELLVGQDRGNEALRWYGTLGESSPYELIYLAPAHARQAGIHGREGRRDVAARHAARAAAMWDSGEAELRVPGGG